MSNDTSTKPDIGFVTALVLFALSIPLAFYRAFFALVLYRWFVLPVGAPNINIGTMAGVMLLYSLFGRSNGDEPTKGRMIRAGTLAIVYPPIVVSAAWIVKVIAM